ncbi:hypothetical protein D0Y65_006236 [Glycine soja]|nr:hypothetical protein D0Y65_006236 [Glycine soja]
MLQRTVEWILPTPTPYRLVEPVQVIELTSSKEDPEEDPEELPPEHAVDALDFLEGDEDPLPEVDSPEEVMSASEADSTEDGGPGEMAISGGSSSLWTGVFVAYRVSIQGMSIQDMKHKVDLVCIQETKKESFDKLICQSMWGDSYVSWDFVPSIQASGGSLCLWNNSDFQVERRVKGRNFLMLEGKWVKENQWIRIVNVYAPCDLAGKRTLWDDLGS